MLIGCLAMAAVLTATRGDAEVIVSCGFETSGDSWEFSSTGGGYQNELAGIDDVPSKQRILSGSGSWTVNDSTSIIEFSEVLLSGWTNLAVRYHVSSTTTDPTGGHTPDDYVAAYVAATTYDNQAAPVYSSEADITLKGYGSGAVWGFSPTTAVEKEIGWGGILQPGGDGIRTEDGYNDFTIQIPNLQQPRSLKFKLSIKNTGSKKYWNIDDVSLEGERTVGRDLRWNGGDNGLWDNSETVRWDSNQSGESDSPWDSANGDNAFFTVSGERVKIASAATVAARSLTFSADGCTIAAGDSKSRLGLTDGGSGGPGANTIEVGDAGHTATIDVTINGNPGAGLTKTGAGTLVLAKANRYYGTTTIEEGTLRVSKDNQLSTTGAGVAFDGGTLQFSAAVDVSTDRPFQFLADGGTIDVQQFDCSAATTDWSGSGGLTKLGEGTLALQGENYSFTGEVLVQEGVLRLENNGVLDSCPTINVAADATLDLSGVAEGYRFGSTGSQELQGSGTVIGNLEIGQLGVHDLGHSPGVQCVEGDYAMNGSLRIEIGGATPGEGGYDQVLVTGTEHDVSLAGSLSLAFGGDDWASLGDELWIIRNDTDGGLEGEFFGLTDGALAGVYDGLAWHIYYAAGDGNDVLLRAAAEVPEPGTLFLLCLAGISLCLTRKAVRAPCHSPALC